MHAGPLHLKDHMQLPSANMSRCKASQAAKKFYSIGPWSQLEPAVNHMINLCSKRYTFEFTSSLGSQIQAKKLVSLYYYCYFSI